MLKISNSVTIPSAEIELQAIRAQGAGGQNVNKVSTAVHLRFDIMQSSLPELYKKRLMNLGDYRITKEGVIIIKAQRYRSQLKNKEDALLRLKALINRTIYTPQIRKATKPSKAAKAKRLENKKIQSKRKVLRRKDRFSD